MPEQDQDARELDHAKEVGRMVFPTGDHAAVVVQPSEQPHTFQAPEFYARLGYEAVARINDYPNRHADIFLAKRLAT